MSLTARDVAQRFASALDAEDYEAVRQLLAPSCVYHARSGVLIGSDALLASYRSAAASARLLESVEYASTVLDAGPSGAVVEFSDHLLHLGRSHTYRCRQAIRVNAAGLIETIQHEELAGERERLEAFLTSVGR
jgi:hypothetical protein